MVKNPKFAAFHITDIPEGHLQKITVKIKSNTQTEAQQVLNNQADAFDPGDTLPPALLPQIQLDGPEPVRAGDDPVDVLLLPQHADQAVQQPARARGGQLRARPARAGAPGQRLPQAGLLLPAGGDRGPPDVVPVRRPQRRAGHGQGQAAGPAVGHGRHQGHGVGRDAQPAQGVRRLLHRRAEQDRVQGDAEDHRRRDLLPDDRQREDQGRRRASPTGSRTSPTRRTSTCCSTTTPSRRPTTRTSATSTIRRSRRSWRSSTRFPRRS